MTFREDVEELIDRKCCGTDGCDCQAVALYFHCAACKEDGLRAYYEDGILHLLCPQCDDLIVQLEVARRPTVPEGI